MQKLTSKQLRFLRSLGHGLNPAAQMGKSGYSDAFRKEIDRNLEDHELIKIRLGSAEDQTEFKDYATMIADEASAHLVQTIGRIALLYRRRKEKPEIIIPRAV